MKPQSKIILLAALILLLLSVTLAQADDPAPYLNPDLPVDQRVEDLLGRMSLAEKIGQMTLIEKASITSQQVTQFFIGGVLSGGGGYPSPNTAEAWAKMVDGFQDGALATPLAIPMIYGVDAVHGHNNLQGATIFPQEIGLGATRDTDLVKQIGRATAQEMIATGIYWDYAPVVAVPQDIRWGRTYEGYGENTELVSTLGAAFIEGLQTDNLGNPQAVLATAKHFVGDGGAVWGTSGFGPSNIDQGVTDVDEATLRAIHLPPYEAAIKAGAQSIMVSYSSWGGMKMSAQKYLITDVLEGELGFTGFVVSDWQALNQISPDTYQAIVTGINAGIDMNMVPQDYRGFIATMKQAVGKGDISEARIDDAVRRILRVKFEMGLFEHPKSDSSLLATVGSDDHRALARRAVSESLVLLKNDGEALPIAKDTPTIYVAGSAADDIGRQSGGWTIEWQGKVGATTPGTTILQGIQNAVGAGANVQYDADGKFDSTVADVGIVVVGEYPYTEYKGDNSTLNLSPDDINLIETMRAESKKLIVVLVSGRPLIIDSALNTADAFVAAWLPGTEGEGVADVLFGDQPFTGKLSYTWPRNIAQIPFDFNNLATTGCDAPLFPYGYGLDASNSSSPSLDLAAQCSGATTISAEAVSQPVAEATVKETVEPTVEPTAAPEKVVNDFEGTLWAGFDADGAGIGLVTWGDVAENTNLSIRQLIPYSMLAVPGKEAAVNDVLAVSYNITGWGGFTEAFTDGTTWTTQDWSAYSGIRFWLYGNNTGSTIQMDLLENRNPAVKGDSAERWFYRFDDDYTGWKQFTIPFAEFHRRTDFQPNGAPDDGLGLTQVSGYALIFPANVGARTAYLDDVSLVNAADTTAISTVTPTEEVTSEGDNNIDWNSRQWTLAWSDEFNGAAGTPVDSANWTVEIGGDGWGNGEFEYYTDRPENASMDGEGNLAIVARQENVDNARCFYGKCLYTSARLITQGHQAFTYGRIEARIKIPRGQGIWPAFWMLGTDIGSVGWPNSGEIDIMENIGKEPQIVHGTIHGPGYSGGQGITAAYTGTEDFADDFHVYAIDWDPNVIRWYVDGKLYSTVSADDLHGKQWVYDHDFFILLNVAIGGQWPGAVDTTTQFPQTMLVDYVRVYNLAAGS